MITPISNHGTLKVGIDIRAVLEGISPQKDDYQANPGTPF